MGALWATFMASKAGRCLAAIGGFLLALAVFAFYVWRKATQHQADKDEAKNAAERVQQAQVAQETYQQATEAAAKVEADAKAAPPPDTVKRDDLDNTF